MVSWRFGSWASVTVSGIFALIGCAETNNMTELEYIGEKSLSHYVDKVSDVSYPSVHTHTPDQVKFSDEPRTLNRQVEDEPWEMTLVEALHTALANNSVLRGANTRLLAAGSNAQSVYDPAIQYSNVLFGSRGVEAALSSFDTQFSTSMVWGRNENVANSAFFGPAGGGTLKQETGNFNASLTKTNATGGRLSVSNTWNYLGTNTFGSLFPSTYTGNVEAGYRQPLWAGAGVEYTRIAGPTSPNLDAITGVGQGVIIARINNDVSVAQFQQSVRDLLRDVESAYWDLYLAYRTYDAALTARDSSWRSWRDAKLKLEVGGGLLDENFRPSDEAQARDQYFEPRAASEDALNRIYTGESELRRLMGIALNDGKVIRPATEPTMAKFNADWYLCLAEALTNRAELRQQKWNIKSQELQLQAAKSLVNPRLDFVSAYRVNGFGDQLWGYNDADNAGTPQGLRYAWESITQGNQTGWNLGLELSMPLGFRNAHSQVRNLELRVRKAREVLAAQEMEVSHDLASSFQDLAANYATAQSNYNRWRAAKRRVDLFQEEEKAGSAKVDDVLRAQRSQANAEIAFYTSLINYTRAIMQLEYSKGTLLQFNNVQLEEGQWEPAAYREALRRAWARTYGIEADGVKATPEYFSTPGFVGAIEVDPYKTLNGGENSDWSQPVDGSLGPVPSPAPPVDDYEMEQSEDPAVPPAAAGQRASFERPLDRDQAVIEQASFDESELEPLDLQPLKAVAPPKSRAVRYESPRPLFPIDPN